MVHIPPSAEACSTTGSFKANTNVVCINLGLQMHTFQGMGLPCALENQTLIPVDKPYYSLQPVQRGWLYIRTCHSGERVTRHL